MRLLLDTHTAIWAVSDSRRLPDRIKSSIQAPQNQALVSSATIIEIAIKFQIGKRDAPPFGGTEAVRLFSTSGLSFLPILPEHAAELDNLQTFHKDPFDRILIAQARLEMMTLVTSDGDIGRYDCSLMQF